MLFNLNIIDIHEKAAKVYITLYYQHAVIKIVYDLIKIRKLDNKCQTQTSDPEKSN